MSRYLLLQPFLFSLACTLFKLLLLLFPFVRSAKAWKSQLHPSTLPTHHHSTPGKVFWHNFQCWLIRFPMFDNVYWQRSLYWCMSYEGLACQELICWLLPNMDPKYHLYSAQPPSPDLWQRSRPYCSIGLSGPWLKYQLRGRSWGIYWGQWVIMWAGAIAFPHLPLVKYIRPPITPPPPGWRHFQVITNPLPSVTCPINKSDIDQGGKLSLLVLASLGQFSQQKRMYYNFRSDTQFFPL